MTTQAAHHVPVLAQEVLQGLSPQNGEIHVDATFGRGGYSELMLQSADCRVIGIDRDPDAIQVGKAFESKYPQFKILHGSFGEMQDLLQTINITQVDGIAFDLGVSSPQIDTAERGFSFRLDGPLDMRMSGEGPSAADLVNQTAEAKLANIIYQYGEEKASRKIARAIVDQRKVKKFTRTLELADLIKKLVPKQSEVHPATKTFQALRIAVNDELGELERGLKAAEQILAPKGRLAIVTFHSLEDRIVKNFLREGSGRVPTGSRHRPDMAYKKSATFRVVSLKAIAPSQEETQRNPRARSAKLRIAERMEDNHAA